MDRLKRGDLVTIAVQGDFGKPRPALVIQNDQFAQLGSVVVLPITSTVLDAPLMRVTVYPDAENGLQKTSQVMVDKIITVKKEKAKQTFGRMDEDVLLEVDRCLTVFLGIAN